MSQIPSTASVQSAAARATGANDLRALDMDQFLQLLIVEMQHQDPLNPMDNSEVLTQISQIREISATNQLSETLSAVLLGQNITTASSLIGKQISALSDAATNIEGVVDRVTVDVDETGNSVQELKLHVGNDTVSMHNIREILDAPTQ